MPPSQTVLNRKSLCRRYQLWERCTQELPADQHSVYRNNLIIQPQTAFPYFISSFHSQAYRRWCLRHLHCLLSCRDLLYIVFVKQFHCRIGPVAVLLSVCTWPCRGIVVCLYLALSRYCCLSVPGPVAVLSVGTSPRHGIVVCRYLALLSPIH